MGDCPATTLSEFAEKLNCHALKSAPIKIGGGSGRLPQTMRYTTNRIGSDAGRFSWCFRGAFTTHATPVGAKVS
jgi:hypothetical protein